MSIYFIILLELVFIAALILALYHYKSRLGLVPLYIVLGSNQLFVTLLGTKLEVDILGGLFIPVGQSIVFAAGFFAVLLIYIKEGVRVTQQLIIAIIIANLSLTILTSLSNWQEILMTGSSSVIFYSNFRVFAFGMLTLILDVFILIILYEFFYSKLRIISLYPRLALSLLVILNFDAFVFVTGGFFDRPDYTNRLLSHIFGKSVAAIFFATCLYAYLRYFSKSKIPKKELRVKRDVDIFSILTYKERFEKIKKEKAVSEEQLQKIISANTEELEKAIRRFTILSTAGKVRIDRYSSAELAKDFLLKIKEAFAVDICTLHLLKEDKLNLFSSTGLSPEEKEVLLDATTPFFNKIISKKTLLAIEDTGRDAVIQKGKLEGKLKFDYISCIGVPMILGEKVIGVLKLYSRETKRIFTPLEKEHLQLAASQVSGILENARLYEQNEKHKEVLVKQILARKSAEQAIQENEHRLIRAEQMGNLGHGFYFIKNEHMQFSEGLYKIFAINPDNFPHTLNGIMSVIHPDDALLMQQSLEKLLKTGEVEVEFRIRRPDNSVRNVLFKTVLTKNKDGEPEEAFTTALDVTDRVKAEQEKQALLIRNQQTIETMLDGFILADEEGNIIEVNPSYCKLTGYTREELTHMNINSIESTLSKEAIDQRIQEMLKKKSIQFETRHRAKDGSLIDLEVSISIMTFDNKPLVAAFLKDITARKKAEEEKNIASEQMRQLTAHLLSIREEERLRIGREIHDDLGQQLTAIKMDIAWLEKKIPEDSADLKSKFKNIIYLLDSSNKSIRRILSELRPGILDEYGLIDAMEWHGKQFTENTGIPVKIHANDMKIKLSEEINTCIYRVFQESLTNVARYASAKTVQIFVEYTDHVISINIEDDGVGFNPSRSQPKKTFGILGMKERVRSLNGTFELESIIGKGTKVYFSLPTENSLSGSQ